MSNADELQIWFDGVQLYDDGEISRAIEMFQSAKQTSKMMFNIGCCYLKGEDLDGGEEVSSTYHASVILICGQP